jgi:hypothetical protein
LFPPDDERLSLETCRGRKINTLEKVKKVRQVGGKSRIEVLKFIVHVKPVSVKNKNIWWRSYSKISVFNQTKLERTNIKFVH